MKSFSKSPVLLDIAMVLLLAAGNFAFAPSDPGWLARQPTPWIILPIWFGLRHGIAAGILTASSVFLATMAGHTGGMDLDAWGHFIHRYRGLFYWSVVLGALSGEACSRWNRARFQQAREAGTLESRLQSAQAAARRLREARDELAKAVALHDSGLATLDETLRGLSAMSAGELPRLLLLAAQRHGRLSEAALYLGNPSGSQPTSLRREAFIGRESQFPSLLQPGSCELVDTALENRKLVSVPELPPSTPGNEPSPYLIAAPFCTPAGEVAAILLVSALAPPSSEARLLDTLALIASRGGCLLGRCSTAGKGENMGFERVNRPASAK